MYTYVCVYISTPVCMQLHVKRPCDVASVCVLCGQGGGVRVTDISFKLTAASLPCPGEGVPMP